MRNHRIYHGERPVSALMSHAQAYRALMRRVASVPSGQTLTVRDRRTGRIVATRTGTGTGTACPCCPMGV